MTTKVTGPLFATTASGKVSGFGTFQKKRSSHYVALNIKGNKTTPTQNRHQKNGFKAAFAQWLRTPTMRVHSGNKITRVHNPRWPAFWSSFSALQATKPYRTADLS